MRLTQAAGRSKVLLITALVGVSLFAFPAFAHAFAYHADGREDGTMSVLVETNPEPDYEFQPYTFACEDCHGLGDESTWTGGGPHRDYQQYTRKCQMCHDVHMAPPDSEMLLPGATVRDTCFTCHDSTGAVGVYSSIEARGASVGSSHAVETTTAVPGGSTHLGDNLNCLSCHSVHSATLVEPFLRDTGRALASKVFIYSNCLLRDDVGGKPRGTYTQYGGAWCASCHDQRMGTHATVHNHPTTETPLYELGRDNAGYTVAETPGRAEPYCMQCHEDSRDVETAFSANMKDYGYPEPDAPTNPAFVTFPHQTVNASMTVEAGDDLCDNCHVLASLP